LALETTPPSQQSDGFLRIGYIPSGNNLSVAVLGGGTEKDLTYSFTPTGFNRKFTEATVTDPRLTNVAVLARPGTFTEQIDIQYVVSGTGAADIAYTALQSYSTGFLSLRYTIANSIVWTVGQKVDSIAFVAGKQMRDAPTANGLFTVSQTLYLTSPSVADAVLIA
jgi:hypothetical protein